MGIMKTWYGGYNDTEFLFEVDAKNILYKYIVTDAGYILLEKREYVPFDCLIDMPRDTKINREGLIALLMELAEKHIIHGDLFPHIHYDPKKEEYYIISWRKKWDLKQISWERFNRTVLIFPIQYREEYYLRDIEAVYAILKLFDLQYHPKSWDALKKRYLTLLLKDGVAEE